MFAACRSTDEAEPPFPIATDDESAAVADDDDEQSGWYYTGEQRSITAAGTERNASVLSGGRSGVQSLNVSADGQHAWNEFLWDDPMWSARTADEPTWVTHEEAGAFEPPYRFAYSTEIGFATQMAAVLDDRVFEGTVTSAGVDYLLYCAGPAGLLQLGGDDDSQRTLRFAVHPDGYVAEWVLALVAPAEVSCDESSLRTDPDLDAVGLHDDLPADWMTTLTLVPSCRGVWEEESAKFAAATGGSSASESSAPESTGPPDTALATDWHEGVNAECADLVAAAAGGAAEELIARMAQQFEAWSDDAPGDLERAALTSAAAALRSDETRADYEAMDRIGRDLANAGLGDCGAMFISG